MISRWLVLLTFAVEHSGWIVLPFDEQQDKNNQHGQYDDNWDDQISVARLPEFELIRFRGLLCWKRKKQSYTIGSID